MASEMKNTNIPAELVDFRKAVDELYTLPTAPSNDEKLTLYGYFKQALIGDNNTDKPGFMEITARYKWDAWTKNKGMSKEDAQAKYITFVKTLKSKYG